MAAFPGIAGLAEIADTGLHPAVHAWVPRQDRLDALGEELSWEIDVAGRDLEWARDFAVHQPASGAPAEMFLNRWLPAGDDLTVLAGPRYEGRNPNRPFAEVTAADRLLTATDLPALRRLAREDFAVFHPLDIRVWTADPPGTWPGTRTEMLLVAAPLGQLPNATSRTRSRFGPQRTCPGTTGTSRPTTGTSPPTPRTRTAPGSRQPPTSTSCAQLGPCSRSSSTGTGPGSSPPNPSSRTASAEPRPSSCC